jgi:two-component system sensor histidine kinase DegS
MLDGLTQGLARLIRDFVHSLLAGAVHTAAGRTRAGPARSPSAPCNGCSGREMAESGIEEVKEQFDEISATATQSLDEIREISRDLRPYHLEPARPTHSIEDMVERISASSEIQISSPIAQINGAIPKDHEINLYRIVQEALTNVVKHSQAAHAWVEITREARQVVVTIRDDGRGFDGGAARTSASPKAGFGLAGIAQRVQMLGGHHTIISTPGRGTTIQVVVAAVQDQDNEHRSALSDA